MRFTRNAYLFGLLVVTVVVMSSCKFLYVSPVPPTVVAPKRLQISSSSHIRLYQGRPALEIVVEELSQPGWLILQWFGPDNREVASESFWITSNDEGVRRLYLLPPNSTFLAGEWRVIASFANRVVRQITGSLESMLD